MTKIDNAVNPSHHKGIINNLEYMDIMAQLLPRNTSNPYHAALLANVYKYLFRCGHKDAPEQELKKAQWYLNRLVNEIAKEKEENNDSEVSMRKIIEDYYHEEFKNNSHNPYAYIEDDEEEIRDNSNRYASIEFIEKFGVKDFFDLIYPDLSKGTKGQEEVYNLGNYITDNPEVYK